MLPLVYYIAQTPFTERDKERYGINHLRGYEGLFVQTWDLSSLFLTTDKKQKKDVLKDIRELPKNTVIIILIGYRPASLWLYRAIAKAGLKWGLLEMNATPTHPKNDSVKNLLERAKSLTWQKAKHFVFPRIPYKILGVSPASFQVLGGSMSIHHNYPVDEKTKTIWSHHPDYVSFVESLIDLSGPIVQTPYCVFLDEYLPLHPDYAYNGKIPPYDPNEYYATMRDFFDGLEKFYRVQVVIALHPRAEISSYGKRTVQKGNTAFLVRHCDFVITHASNSVNFAVLFKKPILFAITESIKKDPHEYGIVQWMTKWLCQDPIQIEDKKFPLIPFVNNGVYDRYEEAYIRAKMGTEFVGFKLGDYLKGRE